MSSPPPSRGLPALSESRWLRFGVFFAFYVVQGFPIGLTMRGFPAWLTAQNLGDHRIGTFLFVSGLPWALKFIAGPIMDRLSFPAMGTRRPWVIGAQATLAVSGCSLFFLSDPHSQFWALTIACTSLNVFAAFQDVAVDGMAISVLNVDERARANAFMIGGQVAGATLTGAASVPLLNAYGIPAAGVLTVVAVGLVSVVAVLFRERPGERLLPWSPGVPHPDAPKPLRNTPRLFIEVVKLLVLPMSLVLIAAELSYRILEGITLVWWPEIAIKTYGFTDEQFAFWNSTADTGAVVVGIALGFLIDRIGAKRGIVVGLLCNAGLYFALWLTNTHLHNPWFAVSAVLAASIGVQWMFISTVSLFMNICGLRVAASQFAVYMALSNFGRNSGARIYAWLNDWISVNGVFLFMAVGYLVSLLVLSFFDLQRHRRRLAELGEI